MDDAEAFELSSEISERAGAISVDVIAMVRREPADQQTVIAMALLGRLFGTAYSATLAHKGPKGALLWAEGLLLIAERTISGLGGHVSFTVAVKEG